MNSYVVEPSPTADTPPRLLDIGEMRAGVLADDDLGIVFPTGQGRQDTYRVAGELNRAWASCRIAELEFGHFQVDVLSER